MVEITDSFLLIWLIANIISIEICQPGRTGITTKLPGIQNTNKYHNLKPYQQGSDPQRTEARNGHYPTAHISSLLAAMLPASLPLGHIANEKLGIPWLQSFDPHTRAKAENSRRRLRLS